MNLVPIPWDFVLILALLGTIVPWRGTVRMKRLLKKAELGSADRLSLYASTILFQAIIVAIVAWRAVARGVSAEELALAGVLLDGGWRVAYTTVIVTGFLCASQIFGLRRIAGMPPTERGTLFVITEKIMPRTARETWAYAALAFTAGVSEEFLYRGFVFASFARIFAGTGAASAAALGLSSAWFSVAHLYQGKRGIITTFIVAAIFCSTRIWTHSLIPPIIAHIGVDLTVGLYAPRLLRSA